MHRSAATFFAALACLLALVSSHDILYKTRLICGPEGPPTHIEWLLFNDYGYAVNLSTVGASMGSDPRTPFVPGTTITFGPTPGCTTTGCRNYVSTIPAWDSGLPSVKQVSIQLTATANYASCKAGGGTNCGNPFQSTYIKGKAFWPYSPYTINPWSKQQQITESMVDTQCPPDVFNCPAPPSDECGIGPCRCNEFKFLQIKTNPTTHQTLIRVNVTNKCADAFYYAGFGLGDDLTLVSPTAGQNYVGTNYQWTVSVVNVAQQPRKWLRFNTKAGTSGDTRFTNTSANNKNWDVFAFTVSGYTPLHLWTVQGHQGAKWDTFTNVDVSSCLCPDCDSTNSDCPTKPGYTGANCTECDRTPLPGDGSYTWFCVRETNPANPWRLVKIISSKLGTAPYVAPGFVPSTANGELVVDSDGFVINCNCTRQVYDCKDKQYCSGVGECIEQNGTCICPPNFLPPDCRAPTTPPPTTTAPPPTSSVVMTTSEGQTAPPSTTPTPPPTVPPPCYNGGDYCSGRGVCTNDVCVCNAGFEGAKCEQTIDNERHCDEFMTCETCSTGAAAAGLNCSWCRDVAGGGCLSSENCLNKFETCGATGISFTPEPCPDDCSGNNGACVNVTCSEYAKQGQTPPKLNGQLLCINDSASFQYDADRNETVYVPQDYASYCVCKKGYRGSNCGGKTNNLGKALAISGGVIAAIVICGVIVVLIIAFGAKKGVDFVLLNHQAASNFKNNPIEESRNKEQFSAIHQ